MAADELKGLLVEIQPRSKLYRGPYQVKILEEKEKSLIISVPVENGKMALLPVGTILDVSWKPLGGVLQYYQAEVISRKFGDGRHLTITKPGVIARSQGDKVTREVKVVAVASGKGGVGKSSLLTNIALATSRLGQKACLIDVDLGTANVDVLLNLKPGKTLNDVISGQENIVDIILKGPEGLLVVPGGSGLAEVANLRDWQFSRLISAFNDLESHVDIIFLDTGAGISRNVTNFLAASDEIVIVTTPDPHAMMDAYSLVKVVGQQNANQQIQLIVNRVESEQEGMQIYQNISHAARHFLNVPIVNLGIIPHSPLFARCVRSQMPLLLYDGDSPLAKKFMHIASRLTGITDKKKPDAEKGLTRFIKKLKNFMQ